MTNAKITRPTGYVVTLMARDDNSRYDVVLCADLDALLVHLETCGMNTSGIDSATTQVTLTNDWVKLPRKAHLFGRVFYCGE